MILMKEMQDVQEDLSYVDNTVETEELDTTNFNFMITGYDLLALKTTTIPLGQCQKLHPSSGSTNLDAELSSS